MSADRAGAAGQGSHAPRILVLCRHFQYGYGGVPQAVFLLAKGLSARGVACDVATDRFFVADAGDLVDLPASPKTVAMGTRRSINAYGGVYIAGAWQKKAIPVALAARRAGIPVVYAPKGQLCAAEFRRTKDIKKLGYLALIEIRIALIATTIHFTSQLECHTTWLAAVLKRGKGIVVPEPMIGGIVLACTKSVGSSVLLLGFIAQISPRKRLRQLIEGFFLFCERHPNVTAELVIAGTAVASSEHYVASARALLDTHPAGSRVYFVGQLCGTARDTFYSGLDAVVIPSRFESFGLAVPEALAHGCAVIAGPNLGVLEFMRGDPAITVMDDVSTVGIAEGIARFAATRDGYCAPGAAAERRFAALAPEAVAEALLPYLLAQPGRDFVTQASKGA